MAKDLKLTTAAYLVLGLVEACEPVTPYELKQFAAISVMRFWSLPHTQIYTQCDRLTDSGLLRETREAEGRRRRSFSITAAGKSALQSWREDASDTQLELRDVGLLKIFFGADPKQIAEHQLTVHQASLELYQSLADNSEQMTDGMRLALDAGLSFEHNFIRFWKKLAAGQPTK